MQICFFSEPVSASLTVVLVWLKLARFLRKPVVCNLPHIHRIKLHDACVVSLVHVSRGNSNRLYAFFKLVLSVSSSSGRLAKLCGFCSDFRRRCLFVDDNYFFFLFFPVMVFFLLGLGNAFFRKFLFSLLDDVHIYIWFGVSG